MGKISKNLQVQVPKAIANALEWKPGDEIETKILNLSLLNKILTGQIKMDDKKMPIILINKEVESNERKNKSIFD